MRVYVPATVPLLARWLAEREVPAGPAQAVTPTLREWYHTADLEELEYAALTEAAGESLRLLAADEAAVRRRVVVSIDVDRTERTDRSGRAAVDLVDVTPWAKVAAVHIDDVAAVSDVSRAVAALAAADAGEEDARFVVEAAEAHELAWYATQEVPELLTEEMPS
jgi:hypothetical protein